MTSESPSSKMNKSSGPTVDQQGNSGQQPVATEEMRNMAFLLDLQAVLRKLQVGSVRSDFVGKKLINAEDLQETMQSFDALYKVLTPEWHFDVNARKENITSVMRHVDLLMSMSDEILVLPNYPVNSPKYTYASWMHGIRRLMSSAYWTTHAATEVRLPSQAMQGEKMTFIQESAKASGIHTGRRVGFSDDEGTFLREARETCSADFENTAGRELRDRRQQHCEINRGRRPGKTLVGAEYTDTTSQSSDDSDTTDDDYCIRRRSRHYREIVQPEPFDIEGRLSLRKFLENYERYFKNKFEGNQRDCTRELARFITGELREAYDALGGSQRKYRDMKELLLEWYRTQRVGRAHRWKTEFQQAEMKRNESLKLYCMRLEDLAQRAYSADDRECIKQLKTQFVKTAPVEFLKHMEERERIKMALHQGGNLSWKEIVELAEWTDKKKKKLELHEEVGCLDSDIIGRLERLRTTSASASLGTVVQEGTRTGRMYDNSPKKTRSESLQKYCHWCGRAGHIEEDCWKKKGVCTLCGSGSHTATACRKYVAKRTTQHFSPVCSTCRGNHCGQDCPNRPSTSGMSNFLGTEKLKHSPLN